MTDHEWKLALEKLRNVTALEREKLSHDIGLLTEKIERLEQSLKPRTIRGLTLQEWAIMVMGGLMLLGQDGLTKAVTVLLTGKP